MHQLLTGDDALAVVVVFALARIAGQHRALGLLSLSSWAGRTPLDHQSGKRAGRARHKKGNKYPGAITGETAVAAGKTQTREGARYRLIYLSHWRRGFWQC